MFQLSEIGRATHQGLPAINPGIALGHSFGSQLSHDEVAPEPGEETRMIDSSIAPRGSLYPTHPFEIAT